MAADPLSPIAPARVRVLILPVGRIKRKRFMTFVGRLQQESTVRLGDISPYGRPDKNMFSPLAFPNGVLLYNFSTSVPATPHSALTPFELFREPMIVLGITDAEEYREETDDQRQDSNGSSYDRSAATRREELESTAEELREQYPKVLVTQLLIFNNSREEDHAWVPEGAICVPPVESSKTTTMKTIMCDVSAKLLSEMTTYARAVQALPSVQSPTLAQNSAQTRRPLLDRTSSLRGQTPRSESPGPANDLSRSVSQSRGITSPPPGNSYESRPTSPNDGRAPPTSFDEIANAAMAGGLSRSASRASEKEGGRTASRDRSSIQSFPSSSTTAERARLKGKSRVGIVVGSLYLIAGRWSDAWRELIEHTSKARTNVDYLWHAKGLENLLTCMLLFAWAGFDFQIPAICQPSPDRPSSVNFSNSIKETQVHQLADDPAAARQAAQRLANVAPSLVNLILSYYERAGYLSSECLPQVAHAGSILRLTRVLALLHRSGGALDRVTLQAIVAGDVRSLPHTKPGLTIDPGLSKHFIAELIFRAYPVPGPDLVLSDNVSILAGIASVLSILPLERKRAIVLKELIASLVPALVQARKIGAAEAGIHPATSLSLGGEAGAASSQLLLDDQESGIGGILRELHGVYGAQTKAQASSIPEANGPADSEQNGYSDDSFGLDSEIDRIAASAANTAASQIFGSLNLKIDILRACIDFCEALPDPAGVIDFAALLLRVAGPQTAIGPSSSSRHVRLAVEEQNRLVSNMARMISASQKMGLPKIQANYWDDFLVRDLRCAETDASGALVVHDKSDLESTQRKSKTPFLYDAFAKKAEGATKENVVVAGESINFVITLQNPYDLELNIDSIRLVTDGIELTTDHGRIVLGPARLQSTTLTATAKTAGPLKVLGCTIQVFGCAEQFFPVYRDAWSSDVSVQVKNIGIPLIQTLSRSVSETQKGSRVSQQSPPSPYTLPLTVVATQPHLAVHDVALSESALMVLEGERKSFQVTLRNLSPSVTVDFLHVSFEDSLSTSIRNALTLKDMSRAETYELELQLTHDPLFKWRRVDKEGSSDVAPGEEAVFEISVVGRPGLGAARVLFDYASLGKPSSEVEGRFFTRQVSVPIDITVNASVQLHRVDVANFPSDFAWSNQHRQRLLDSADGDEKPRPRRSLSRPIERGGSRFKALLERVGVASDDESHYLLLLDIRNAWPSPLSVSIDVREPPSPSSTDIDTDTEDWKRAYTVRDVIHPGHIARLVLLLPRLYLPNPHAPIPVLSRKNERQFVVSTDVFSPAAERAARESFWFREAILKRLRGVWKEENSEREGEIALRGIRLAPRMVEGVRLRNLSIELSITGSDPSASPTDGEEGEADKDREHAASGITQLGHARYSAPVAVPLILRARIRNRSASTPIRGILRLQPRLSNQLSAAALDVGKRLMWTGLLQRPLPALQPGQTISADLGIVVLAKGDFEVGALVEEVRVAEVGKGGAAGEEDGGDGAEDMEGRGLWEGMERRVWCAREPCTIHAKDAKGI